ncbi:MAG TPA: 1-phosphofructokinase [Clostridiales bacterium]|nr:1-phosphofructokinase [Clostridiales bacterium]
MIITVTMNPAIDKTVDIDDLQVGALNRLTNVISDAGGKGINVSKTIKELGGESIATGFVGGSAGAYIEKVLKELGIQSDFVHVGGETRTNLKLVESNGLVTELNEPGPIISRQEMDLLVDKLLGYANIDTLFVISGSIPGGMDKTIYKTLISMVKEKGAKVFLDADGELFVNSLEAKPDIIKPNRTELEGYYGMDYRANEEELADMGRKLLDMGIETVAISLGQMGAIFLEGDHKLRCPGIKVEAHSTVGAGDAMVAAISYGIDKGLDFIDCVKLGMATSAGAVTTKGTKPPTRQLVDELLNKVEVIEMEEL